jgi:transcriptional regulator with XRE-family HTH domain
MPVGAELSAAREKLGLSVQDVAGQTKIKIERLRAIEQMDVAALPTLVYLKGFLRAYAAVVQLDADDLTKRYLAELPSSYTAREANPPPMPAPACPERAWSDSASRRVADLPLKPADPKSDVAIHLAIDDVPDLELASPYPAREIRSVGKQKPLPKRQRTPLPRATFEVLRTRATPYAHTALVAVIALMTGWVLGANFGTTNRSTHATVSVDDADPEIPVGTDVDITKSANASHVAEAMGVAAPAVDRAAYTEQSLDAKASAPPIDVSGRWALTNRLEPARSGGDRSFNRGFRLELQQRGNRVSGSGQQWMENGRSIPVHNRPSIRVEGTVSGRRLELNVTDRGTGRSSAGKFVMNVTGEGMLRGRFVGTAANARGMSLARRMEREGGR